MFSTLQAKLVAFLAAVVALGSTFVGVYLKGRSDKGEAIEVDATKDALKRAVKADEVEDEVEKVPDSELDDLLGGWMRDDTNKRV